MRQGRGHCGPANIWPQRGGSLSKIPRLAQSQLCSRVAKECTATRVGLASVVRLRAGTVCLSSFLNTRITPSVTSGERPRKRHGPSTPSQTDIPESNTVDRTRGQITWNLVGLIKASSGGVETPGLPWRGGRMVGEATYCPQVDVMCREHITRPRTLSNTNWHVSTVGVNM